MSLLYSIYSCRNIIEKDEAERLLRLGTIWKPTWKGTSVDLEDNPTDVPLDWAELTKQEAIELSETLVEKYRYSKPEIIGDVGFLNVLTGERLTLYQMLRRKDGV